MDQAPPQIVSTAPGNVTSVFALQCPSPGSQFTSPALYMCLGQDQTVAGGSISTVLQQADVSGNSTGGLKGRINLLTPGNMIGGDPGTHLITLVDSNPQKTVATGGNRPTHDANDTFIGWDGGLDIGSQNTISHYIGNVGDNVNWKERLTSSLKSFTVPVNTTGGYQQNGTALGENCGTTATCGNTATPLVRFVFGSVPLVSGTPSTATVTGINPAFTSSTSYFCVVTNATTQANPVKVANVSGSSFTVTGPNTVTDTVNYICIGT
jgi:hypothetical protein